MSVALQFKLTQTGQAAVWNANNTGTSLNLTHIQFGSGNRAPSGTETALLAPQQAVAIAAGFSVSSTQIRMSAIFSGNQNYVVREVGLWAGDPAVGGSKLVGYWSQAAGDLAMKSPGVDFIFSHDMTLDAAVPAGSLTILADTAQSAMLAMITAHESKADPHPQYHGSVGDIEFEASPVFTCFQGDNTTIEASGVGAVSGSGGINTVWVAPGSIIDARSLLASEDIIYFRGSWVDYSKSTTAVSGAIRFTRLVDGRLERVLVLNGSTTLGRDKLVFADGAVLTQNANTTLVANSNAEIGAVTGYDPATTSANGPPVGTLRVSVGRRSSLRCNGAVYPISDFPALFTKIGTTFGGDGVTTFGVPPEVSAVTGVTSFIRYE